jgi:hypothetical protein
MKNGVQNSFDGAHGTMYTFSMELEDGTRGQVNSKSPAPYRLAIGEEVEYTYTPNANPKYLGRLKVEKPKDGGYAAPAAGQPARQQSSGGSSGWSPAKEASVLIQGFVKSIVESGAPKEAWGDLLAHAITTHDIALKARMQRMAERDAKVAAEAAAARPPMEPPPAPPPAPIAPPVPEEMASGTWDDAPF